MKFLKINVPDEKKILKECKYLNQSIVENVSFMGFYKDRILKVNFKVNGTEYLVEYSCPTKHLYTLFVRKLRRLCDF